MDLQIVLILILALLTLNLLIVGFYIILVLREFRHTVKKANSVLENVSSITDAISNPLISAVGVVANVLEGVKAVKSIKSLLGSSNEEEDEE